MGKKKNDLTDRYSIKVKNKKHGKNKNIFGVPNKKKKKKKHHKDAFEKAVYKTMKPAKDERGEQMAIPTDYNIDYMLDSPLTGAPLGVYVFEYLEEDGYENTIWVAKVGINSPKLIDIFTGEDVSMKNFRDLLVLELLDMEYLNSLFDVDDDDDEYDLPSYLVNGIPIDIEEPAHSMDEIREMMEKAVGNNMPSSNDELNDNESKDIIEGLEPVESVDVTVVITEKEVTEVAIGETTEESPVEGVTDETSEEAAVEEAPAEDSENNN